ncbi:unnamed protein product [Peniophora sp. CBMAI 1063]|nr:unnamed protein product [Peniophora sp. CBMAI 1063]
MDLVCGQTLEVAADAGDAVVLRSAPPGLLSLPPELLARIEAPLDKESIVSYISTCRRLRGAGTRTLLWQHPVILTTAAGLRSFCRFMHADLLDRKRFLRSFTLDTPFPSPEQVIALRRRLAEILVNAPGLAYLEFGRCLADILEHSPALFSAIHSLRSLTSLKIGAETGTWSYTILRVYNAPLTALDVMGDSVIDAPNVFARYASTLQSLTLGGPSLREMLGPTTYMNVTSFTWYGRPLEQAWGISTMISSFPNLEKLSAWMGPASTPSPPFILPMYEIVRSRNATAQSQRRWPRLRSLSGDSKALFTLIAADCEVDTMSIFANLEPWDSTMLVCKIVRDLRHPLHTLHLQFCSAWPHGSAERLSASLLGELVRRDVPLEVDTLVVELIVPSGASWRKIMNILAGWPIVMGRIAPRYILLHVHVEPSEPRWNWLPQSTAAEEFVQDEHIFRMGETIGASARTTEAIYIRTSWNGGKKTTWWENVSGPRLEVRFIQLTEAAFGDEAEQTVDGILSSLLQ